MAAKKITLTAQELDQLLSALNSLSLAARILREKKVSYFSPYTGFTFAEEDFRRMDKSANELWDVLFEKKTS